MYSHAPKWITFFIPYSLNNCFRTEWILELIQPETLAFWKQIVHNKWSVMLVLIFNLVVSFCNEIEIFKKIYTLLHTNADVYTATYYLPVYSKSDVTIDFKN